MDLVFVVASVVLAAVFTVAAIAKLADQVGAPDVIRAFGVPAQLARPVAVVLPVVELTVAALLLFPDTSIWGGLGALALLGVFIVAMAVSLGRGQRPPCHCFGQVHAKPIGWHTVARNAALAALASFVVVHAHKGEPPSIAHVASEVSGGRGTLAVAGFVVLAVLVVQGWLLLHLMRQQGRLWLRIDTLESALRDVGLLSTESPSTPAGLLEGVPAPAFELPALSGGWVTLEGLLGYGRPVILVFSDPACRPCAELLPELGGWIGQHSEVASLVLVTHGVTPEYRDRMTAAGVPVVLEQRDREVADAFGAAGTPSAVLVDVDGTVGSSLAVGAAAIRTLLMRVVEQWGPEAQRFPAARSSGSPTMPPGVPPGSPMPAFRLPDLDGMLVDSSSFRGRNHLLVFWNPDCGFCNEMLPALLMWEQRNEESGPALVLVSTGTVEANRGLGLNAPVLLDRGFTVGARLGIRGTPSAVLFDGDGMVVAPAAVGGPQIFSLAEAAVASDAVTAEVGSGA